MKQYWRAGTISTLLSLIASMLITARIYVVYIPPLERQGFLGAVFLGGVLVLIFLGIGWYYDAKLSFWNEAEQVSYERGAYQFVPNMRRFAIGFPVLYAMIYSANNAAEKLGTSTDALNDLCIYLRSYYSRSVSSKKDIRNAPGASQDYLRNHPLGHDPSEPLGRIPFRTRIKRSFQIHLLRLNWVQSLTGLVQDSLVLGVVYAPLLLPEFAGDPWYTFFLLTFPLVVLFLAAGWYYDKRLKVWGPDTLVRVERDPYTYVPLPSMIIERFPLYDAISAFILEAFDKAGVDSTKMENYVAYLAKYSKLSASRNEDIRSSPSLVKSFGPVFVTEHAGDE